MYLTLVMVGVHSAQGFEFMCCLVLGLLMGVTISLIFFFFGFVGGDA